MNSEKWRKLSLKELPGDNAYTTSQNPQPWLADVGKNWMAFIPDNTPIHKLSIPGTHDSGALWGGDLIQTQSWRIERQIKGGIRFLDIRVARKGAQQKLFIFHGPFDQGNTAFVDVLTNISNFLRDNPTEVILMRIKYEHGSKDDWLSLWNYYHDLFSHLWTKEYVIEEGHLNSNQAHGLPVLGDIRGKVVLLMQPEVNTTKHGLPWPQGEGEKSNKLVVKQDVYKVGNGAGQILVGTKRKKFLEYIQRTAKPDNTRLTINFLSGSGGYAPCTLAKDLNNAFYDEKIVKLTLKPKGVLVFDFPGDKLIARVIKDNFV